MSETKRIAVGIAAILLIILDINIAVGWFYFLPSYTHIWKLRETMVFTNVAVLMIALVFVIAGLFYWATDNDD